MNDFPIGTVRSCKPNDDGTFTVEVDMNPPTPPKRKAYIVWNEARNEGFVTTEHQLAYEARKGSGGNCYSEEGRLSTMALAFVEEYIDDNCTIQEIEL